MVGNGLSPGGSIPACAGEPAKPAPARAAGQVYPRVCGGTAILGLEIATQMGLSPRVRGNPATARASSGCGGSIPACAGEPAPASRSSSSPWVYPRVCGGTIYGRQHRQRHEGLSPRVRGNLDEGESAVGVGGSIPACAGEPCSPARTPAWRRVYPRVCGGTIAVAPPAAAAGGLSPRVRGNPSCAG